MTVDGEFLKKKLVGRLINTITMFLLWIFHMQRLLILLLRDIDITQLCDIRISSGVGSWDDEISGSEYRNSEYIFTDATSGNGPVKYALDKYDSNETTVGRYYGKGMMTRMTFVPHRKSLVAILVLMFAKSAALEQLWLVMVA